MPQTIESVTDISIWFENFIESIKQDKRNIELGIAPPQKTELYEAAMNKDMDKISSLSISTASMYFITKILHAYISELSAKQCKPINLAFDLNDSEILVWAIINDDDEKTEDQLWLSEAKVNADFYKSGFNISTTIIEKSDNISIPPHYKTIN